MFCEACGALGAKLRCGRCREACYCNRACQEEAWKKGHKLKCVNNAAKLGTALTAPPPPAAVAAAARFEPSIIKQARHNSAGHNSVPASRRHDTTPCKGVQISTKRHNSVPTLAGGAGMGRE